MKTDKTIRELLKEKLESRLDEMLDPLIEYGKRGSEGHLKIYWGLVAKLAEQEPETTKHLAEKIKLRWAGDLSDDN